MLSYQHIYHAGNFADVHKHVLVLHAFLMQQHLASAIAAIDAHGGNGVYDLRSAPALKNKEFASGILKLAAGDGAPAPVAEFLKMVHAVNPTNDIRFYPGSSEFLRRALRATDRLVIVEKHPQAFATLKKKYVADKRVKIFQDDAYDAVCDIKVARDASPFVLFDPAYEHTDEWQSAVTGIDRTFRRWDNAVVLLWYPITAAREYTAIERYLSQRDFPSALTVEFFALPNDVQRRLNGSGVCVINPPPGLAESIEPAMTWLYDKLAVPRAPRWTIKQYRH